MDIKHRDQRRRIRELEGDIVADSDQHRLLQRTKSRSDDDLFVSGIDCEIAQLSFHRAAERIVERYAVQFLKRKG